MQNLKDYLEELLDFRRTCTIKFRAENGGLSIVQSKIADLYSEDETAYIRLEDGLTLRMDSLLEVNGRKFTNYC